MIHAIALAVVLQISNIAHVPGATLERVQGEVATLYRDIGVDVKWSTSVVVHGAQPLAIRVVLIDSAGGDLDRPEGNVMGAAVRTPGGARVAYVFVRQVELMARLHGVSPTRMLACVVAHEVGHLLLPGAGHTTEGLMRAGWSGVDFHRAAHGQLRFVKPSGVLEPAVEQ